MLSDVINLTSDSNMDVFLLVQCADSKVDALCGALQSTVSQWRGHFPSPLPLELYTSANFIGLFVEEQTAETLKKFAANFAAEAAAKAGKMAWIIRQKIAIFITRYN